MRRPARAVLTRRARVGGIDDRASASARARVQRTTSGGASRPRLGMSRRDAAGGAVDRRAGASGVIRPVRRRRGSGSSRQLAGVSGATATVANRLDRCSKRDRASRDGTMARRRHARCEPGDAGSPSSCCHHAVTICRYAARRAGAGAASRARSSRTRGPARRCRAATFGRRPHLLPHAAGRRRAARPSASRTPGIDGERHARAGIERLHASRHRVEDRVRQRRHRNASPSRVQPARIGRAGAARSVVRRFIATPRQRPRCRAAELDRVARRRSSRCAGAAIGVAGSACEQRVAVDAELRGRAARRAMAERARAAAPNSARAARMSRSVRSPSVARQSGRRHRASNALRARPAVAARARAPTARAAPRSGRAWDGASRHAGSVKLGSVGSATSSSRSQPSFSSFSVWIATALALASRSGSAWNSDTQQRYTL